MQGHAIGFGYNNRKVNLCYKCHSAASSQRGKRFGDNCQWWFYVGKQCTAAVKRANKIVGM